jgi:hypothetical protein
MWIWDVASILAGVLVVLLIVLGIFFIATVAILGSGFAIANRKTETETKPTDHPARHLRSVD